MRKLIHPDFELDLSNYKLSVVKQNFWFEEDFFVKYSFPFEIDLTEDIDAVLGFISRYNSKDFNTYIPCQLYENNDISDAILEVEQFQNKLSCVLTYGYDQLPNFEKKLSELPLDKFELPSETNIYAHAKTVISQSWPNVNYNFPQIHTDKIDPDNDDVFFAFEKIINNYKDDEFLINEVVTEGGDDITYNRNIMQPLPYWLHVLTKLFEDVNLTLAGDIVQDSRIQKMCLFGDVDYATTVTQESVSIITLAEDKIEVGPINSYQYHKYQKIQSITNPGRYRVIGIVRIYNIPGVNNWVRIKYRNQVIFYFEYSIPFHQPRSKNVNIVFDTLADLQPNEIVIESYQLAKENGIIFQLDINPIRLHDAEGNPIPSIINKNEIDLTKTVPDMTCRDFLKVIKNWFNYDLIVVGSTAFMNKVENKINYDNAIDLSEHEVKNPLRKFQKGKSFLLKFQDVATKDYTFLPVFQDINGVVNSSYITTDKTTTIEISALPLPLLFRNDVQTAHAFESNTSKPYAVIYDGLTNNLNLAKDPFEIMITQVHISNHKKWFDAQINAQYFTWPLTLTKENYKKIEPYSKIYAYNRYHVVKTINDSENIPDVFDIELETMTLE